MRVGLRRFDVRFFDDLNLGKRQARALFALGGFSFVSRSVPSLDGFSTASLIESGFLDLALAVLIFCADFATGNADLAARLNSDFAMVLFPKSDQINLVLGDEKNGFPVCSTR